MKKSIISACALLVMLYCAATAAVAQDWSWAAPAPITPSAASYVDIEFYPDYPAVSGLIAGGTLYEPLVLETAVPSALTFTDPDITGQGIKSVFAPPVGLEYVIDADTIAGPDGLALDAQPFIPTTDGAFTSIAAGPDGRLYILFTADSGSQYLLEGTSLNPLETVTVRFSPRSLNLGSKGKWVNCKISDFPEGYAPADIDMDSICIVAVNGVFLAEDAAPICSRDSGGPYNNRNPEKLIVKFDRRDLQEFIAANPGLLPNLASITVAGASLDGLVQLYGEDTIKTKAAKVKKTK